MFFALLSTLLWSLANVFWKKCTSYKLRTFATSIWSLPIAIVLCVYFFVSWFTFSNADVICVIVIAWIILLDIVKDPINQQIYREEKISLLIPYQNLHKIFVIICSFFIFSDVSNISFGITIITTLVIFLASFDFKNKKLPRNFFKILFVETNVTIAILLGWWVVLKYWEINYFVIYTLIWASVYTTLVTYTHQISDFKNVDIRYWWNRVIAWLWWVSWFLSLLVIKNLWLSMSILLWFIWIWITLWISYILLGDTPSKKNIILTIVVSLLIWVWYYFK